MLRHGRAWPRLEDREQILGRLQLGIEMREQPGIVRVQAVDVQVAEQQGRVPMIAARLDERPQMAHLREQRIARLALLDLWRQVLRVREKDIDRAR